MEALVVEDHAIFRDLLVTLLEDRVGFTSVCGAITCNDARQAFEAGKFDLVLCDVDLPDGDGLALADEFARADPRLRILAVSGQIDEFTLSRVLHSAVIGFVDKTEDDLKSLEQAVRDVLDWKSYYSRSVQQFKVMERVNPHLVSKMLTDRELELMRYFGLGLRNEEIAKEVGGSPSTIQGHRRNIMAKLELKTTPDLIRLCLKTGFTRTSDIVRRSAED
jgi:two-component system response regulator NreC